MLGKPNAGWCEISVAGQTLGQASYLDFVPHEVLTSLIDSLKNDGVFTLTFDAEEHRFGLIEIDGGVYGWTDANDGVRITTKDLVIDDYVNVHAFVSALATEVIEDILANIDEFVEFDIFIGLDEDDYAQEYETNYQALTDGIEELRQLLQYTEHKSHMPELGNLLFGHSYGEHPIEDRETFQDIFNELLNCGFDSYGHIIDDELERKYCHTKYSEYTNDEICAENCENPGYRPHIHYFDNGVFMMNPYCWADADDLCEVPNFIYYPENLEFRWYKYPWRDAYCNKQIDTNHFKEIIDECIKSLKT